MLLLYYTTLSVLEFSISFSISYNCVIYDCDICDYTVTCVTPMLHLCNLCDYHIYHEVRRNEVILDILGFSVN